jgi:hypothetical protein
MLRNKIILYSVAFFALISFSGCNSASAATLQINSGTTTLAPGDVAVLSVMVDAGGTTINNVEATITFPKDLVSIVSVSKINSVFPLWVDEPSFSNSLGTITFNGGVPTPGFSGSQGAVLSIVVKAKAAGQAEFLFSGAAVRANDGLGTNVLTSKQGKLLVINQVATPPTPTPVAVPVVTPSVSNVSLEISSVSHPKQDQWYNNANAVMRWVIPTGADAIQAGMSISADSAPHVIYSPAISGKTVSDLEDGVWYFKARARRGGAWTPVASYVVRVDTVAPEKNDVAFSYDNNAKTLMVSADIKDVTSGIDRYEVMINDKLVKTFTADELVEGKYSFALEAFGDNTVKLVAFDRAGNSVEGVGTFHSFATAKVEPVEPIVPVREQLMVAIGPLTMAALPLGIVLLVIVLLLILGAYYLGHRRNGSKQRRVRGVLSEGDSLRMMLALKKRLESHLEILQRTRRSRMLTAEEKEIKQAIEGDLDEVDEVIEGYK